MVDIAVDLGGHAQTAIEVYRGSLINPQTAVIVNEKELHRAIVQAMDNAMVEMISKFEKHMKEGLNGVDPRATSH